MRSTGANRGGKRIIVGATGASGLPILVKCLELIGEQPEYESYLIMSHSAVLTLGQETDLSAEQVDRVAYLVSHHHTYTDIDGIDYQILIEADYIVNASESGYSSENRKNFLEEHMKTESGKRLLRSTFCMEA